MRVNDIDVSKNFKLYEFECHDGNHQVKLDPEVVILLQKLREKIGKPLKINSAYRTPEYNRKISGSPNSQHIEGKAVDISCPKGMTVDQLSRIAKGVGFKGIGKYPKQNFVHMDVRDNAKEWTL
ncbi:D-Ala-D-Ala carboxypeptidase family metallohydrolase [Cohnella sp. WQ 127256]|uniref:YcbK family protein n=1 Tax=Cohnella sp. WQ 127256 TaxID=2938790 RepID=UPI002118216A|nr:D-Ala-D-Ala carboxypeptidase family metallohydrolase [Cohnella sp. WQ 127256]